MDKPRQRVTIVIPKEEEQAFHDRLTLEPQSLAIPGSGHRRQDRFTVPISLLPTPFETFISNRHSFRLQYSAEEGYEHSIFGDYPQDGLNLNVVPELKDGEAEAHFKTHLASISASVNDLFGLGLDPESFILTATAAKYFQKSADQDALRAAIERLVGASVQPHWKTLQIDYNPKKSENLIVEIYWPEYSLDSHFESPSKFRAEIGVFSTDPKLTNIDNVALNGVRFIVAKDEITPKKTSFQFVPRQREIKDITFSLDKVEPLGLHPSFKLHFHNDTLFEQPLILSGNSVFDDIDICQLYTVWNVPKQFFLDKYQLDDKLYRDNGLNLVAVFGNSSLELPDYAMHNWGTEAIFELDYRKASSFEVPFHSRYAAPSTSNEAIASLQAPKVFWACDLALPIRVLKEAGATPDRTQNIYSSQIAQFESDLDVLANAPFHYKFLDYESYFDKNTVFYQIGKNGNLDLDVPIPVANIEDAAATQFVTLCLVALSCLYLLRKLFK